MTKVALVLTVKNEDRILRYNLLYHHAVGAAHIFVYFDNATDGGKDSIKDLEFVTIQNSVAKEKFENLPFLDKFTSQAIEHHTARQCLNTYDALLNSREMGYDWLISIDADELVCTTKEAPSDLMSFFAEIDPTVDVVNLKTFEALQQRVSYQNVFSDETYFKTTHRYENRFEKILKAFYNPFTKSKQNFAFWYGQHLGKGALRVSSDIIPHNVHRYAMQSGEKPKTADLGMVLHYHAYDAEDFIKKFTNFSNHPDTFLSGNAVKSQKLLLRDVVNKAEFTQEQLIQYFEDNLLFTPSEVEKLKRNKYLFFMTRKPAALIQINSVQKVFNNMTS